MLYGESLVIEIRHLFFSHRSESAPVLRDITLSLVPGESVAIIGANGSGKTSLLRCINGLNQPTSGEVLVDNLRVSDADTIHEVRKRVGIVFQNPDDQIVSAQVEREIAFGLENIGIPTCEMHSRVDQILNRLGLDRYRKHAPHLLSGGERQRLAIAGALVMRPHYLLMDEPTALLDPGSRSSLMDLLDDLYVDEEITPILVTQSPEEAARANRVVVLNRGEVALDGKPEVVFSEIETLSEMGLGAPLPATIGHMANLPNPLPLRVEDLLDRLPAPAQPSCLDEPATVITTGESVIAACNLCHSYNQGLPGEVSALKNVNLDLKRGSCVALIGPGGSGKSTLAQHLNGLLLPTSGTLHVTDLPILARTDLKALRRKVGLIFQFPEAQLFAETVYEDVSFGPINLGMADIDERVRSAIREVGLDVRTFLDRSPFALSGGEKRRVAIAGVLAMRPEILVMDEPTAGLDPAGTVHITNLLKQLNEQGTTLILITHDMDLVASLAHRVIVLDRGEVALDGTPHEVLRDQDRLSLMDLDLPEAARVGKYFRERSWPIPEEAITVPAILRAIRLCLPT